MGPSTPQASNSELESSGAGSFVAGPGKKWLQVESQSNLAETIARAEYFARTFDHTEAYLTTNGWYAIVVGVTDSADSADVLQSLKASSLVPHDSMAKSGKSYLQRVWPLSPEVSNRMAELTLEQRRALALAEARARQAAAEANKRAFVEEAAEITSTGTGFFVDATGSLLTNAHVVENCSAYRRKFPLPSP